MFVPIDPIPRNREMENLKMWTLETPGMLGENGVPLNQCLSIVILVRDRLGGSRGGSSSGTKVQLLLEAVSRKFFVQPILEASRELTESHI